MKRVAAADLGEIRRETRADRKQRRDAWNAEDGARRRRTMSVRAREGCQA